MKLFLASIRTSTRANYFMNCLSFAAYLALNSAPHFAHSFAAAVGTQVNIETFK